MDAQTFVQISDNCVHIYVYCSKHYGVNGFLHFFGERGRFVSTHFSRNVSLDNQINVSDPVSHDFTFLRFPFNYRTPFGYLIAYIIQAMATLTTAEILHCTVGYVVGICFFISAFISDIKQGLLDLNTELKKINPNSFTREQHMKLRKKQYSHMEFYFVAKELSEKIEII